MAAERLWKLDKTAWREGNWEIADLVQGASAGHLPGDPSLLKPVSDSIAGGRGCEYVPAFSGLSFGCPF